jgi:hypothetical protein
MLHGQLHYLFCLYLAQELKITAESSFINSCNNTEIAELSLFIYDIY